jgi:hypothetical protein
MSASNELLPRQRPNLSLCLKFKQNVQRARFIALHEGCHAVAAHRLGYPAQDLVLIENGRIDARVKQSEETPPILYGSIACAGIVANALCDGSDETATVDVRDFLYATLLVTGAGMIPDGGRERIDINLHMLDRESVLAKMYETWRETVALTADPLNFGAAQAVACEALRHTNLEGTAIAGAIETAQPFTSPALPGRRHCVLMQAAFWEHLAEIFLSEILREDMSNLNALNRRPADPQPADPRMLGHGL